MASDSAVARFSASLTAGHLVLSEQNLFIMAVYASLVWLELLCLKPLQQLDKAPVSKGLMGSMFLTCTAMNMPLLAHMRKYLVCKLPDIFKEREVIHKY
ncbi:unnamed protein product [Timema podura]|uniref:Uncharacterized protein n=1 Tax=Timema podura TaxID=61482 RepID=A0ABN7NUR7_TIMPD|nr:unnamed protein product [Timema podura]